MLSGCGGGGADPPFLERYKSFIDRAAGHGKKEEKSISAAVVQIVVEECKLPLIDLKQLDDTTTTNNNNREKCKNEIAKASREWGFFQVINHGIPHDMLHKMRRQQVHLLNMPFQHKQHFFTGSCYRWGTPSATCLNQVAWSEAFHVPLTAIISSSSSSSSPAAAAAPSLEDLEPPNTTCTTIRSTMEEVSREMFELAQKVAEILGERLQLLQGEGEGEGEGEGGDYNKISRRRSRSRSKNKCSSFFRETCSPNSCYLRMNRYPLCPISNNNKNNVFGLMPHTDSDFITVLHQDEEIGGLQLVKDGKWVAVKPTPQALIVNIGDLFQAWSNGVYKSVEHRVVSNTLKDRFSIAFFMCPSYETVVKAATLPQQEDEEEDSKSQSPAAVYRTFTFKDYRDQVQQDVTNFGHKFGLTRFLANHPT